jgi:hypothetical protein
VFNDVSEGQVRGRVLRAIMRATVLFHDSKRTDAAVHLLSMYI